MKKIPGKAWRFWPLVLVLLLADCTTKQLAVEHLSPPGSPHEIIGNTLRLTLVYNDGGSLGIDTGPVGLKVIMVFSLALIIGLGLFYRSLPSDASVRAVALALLIGGAVGNLHDRFGSDQGVVDFIDVGLGSVRFWVFNVADVGITVGAILLALALWRQPGDTRHTEATS